MEIFKRIIIILALWMTLCIIMRDCLNVKCKDDKQTISIRDFKGSGSLDSKWYTR